MNGVAGLGIDLVDVDRFARVLERRPALAGRLFSTNEVTDAQSRPERLAARFAVKEAVMKVLDVGLGAVAFQDIVVQRLESGAPVLVVSGTAQALAAAKGIRTWHVSLTHTDRTAGAVVIGLT